ncbi:MAG: hybrid sensor histidine kinase/response regulator [Verrucomicrobiota bacterium]|nr:hybrid sensor histidine kinase/response regulator [Verrucomicrobiota bacterium]
MLRPATIQNTDPQEPSPSDGLKTDGREKLAGKTVLVVDDSPTGRRQTRFFLENAKYHVLEAASGEIALELLMEQPVDLILMDIVMEGLDGYETCRRLKALPAQQDVPVIFLTGKAGGDAVVRGLEVGGADYVTKPYHARELLCRVDTHMRMRALMEEQQGYIQRLRKTNAAKDRLMRVASHDLKNPVCAIQGLAKYLVDEESANLGETNVELIKGIIEATDNLIVILDDLLDSSIIDADRLRVDMHPGDVRNVVTEVLTLYQFRAAQKGITLYFESDEIPDDILIDRAKIKRVVENLMSNALKFSPYNSSVTTRIHREGEFVTVQVEDEGTGVPEQEQGKLFQEFGTTSVAPTAGEKSTGLGLHICKRIIQAHKGSIGMHNLPGRGARFYFMIPIVLANTQLESEPRTLLAV